MDRVDRLDEKAHVEHCLEYRGPGLVGLVMKGKDHQPVVGQATAGLIENASQARCEECFVFSDFTIDQNNVKLKHIKIRVK